MSLCFISPWSVPDKAKCYLHLHHPYLAYHKTCQKSVISPFFLLTWSLLPFILLFFLLSQTCLWVLATQQSSWSECSMETSYVPICHSIQPWLNPLKQDWRYYLFSDFSFVMLYSGWLHKTQWVIPNSKNRSWKERVEILFRVKWSNHRSVLVFHFSCLFF